LATLRDRVIAAVDELVDPVASAPVAPIVVRPGVLRAQWSRLDLDGVVIDMGDYSVPVAIHGETLPTGLAVLTSLRRGSAHRDDDAISPGLLHRYGGATEAQGAMERHAAVRIVSASTDALEKAATRLGVDIDRPQGDEVRVVGSVDWPRLHGLLDKTIVTVRSSPVATLDPHLSRSLRDCLLEIIVRTFDRNCGRERIAARSLSSMRITRVCQEHAEATHYHDVSLASLCAATGMSERRVRQAFYECYGMSPTAVLRITALRGVRRSLLGGPPTRDAVSRAASDFGFWHLGRFAGQYRALFGESPSATLSHRSPSAAAG
jgi:AraC-like DNA-binding protein